MLTGFGSTVRLEKRFRRDLTLDVIRRMRRNRRDDEDAEGDQGFCEGILAGELTKDIVSAMTDVDKGRGE